MRKMLLCAAALALAGCASGEVRDTVGLTRAAPDEFKVVSRPPLSVPPDFTLRAPEPGAAPRAEVDTETKASRLFLKEEPEDTGSEEVQLYEPEGETAVVPVHSESVRSSGESLFLERLGAKNPDAEIRSKLAADQKELARKLDDDPDATLIDRLIGVRADQKMVDPFAEAERLRTNIDEGKPINEGEVPILEDEETTLDKIF